METEFTVINPATEEIAASYRRATLDEIHEKARAARRVQRDWADTALDRRLEFALRFCEAFEADAEEIAATVTAEMGKPIGQSRAEVASMLARARSMILQAPEALAPRRPLPVSGFERYVERHPLGVVLNMAAWNYPLLIAVNVVLPAVIAGNAVILKHSARTPGAGEAFERAMRAARLDPHLVQAVQADHETMLQFAAHGDIDHVAFTGSVEGGRAVQSAVRGRFISSGLELGGKDAAYVLDEQDDLDWVAANLAEGFAYNCGQSCCAVERIYVHARVYGEFVERLSAHAQTWVPGTPGLPETNLGPLVSESARRHIVGQVLDAREKGARVVLEGGPTQVAGRGFFYSPEILDGVHHGMKIMREENFGPIVGVMKVEDDAQAIGLINDSTFGLTASVWGKATERARRVVAALSAGTVFLNRCDYLDPALPWTGYRDSGLGSTLGHEGFWNLTRPRSIHMRLRMDARGV